MLQDLHGHQRFAFVIEDLYSGGTQKSLLYTVDQLSQRGYDAIVFILRGRIEHRLLILAFLKERTLPLFKAL